MSTEIEAQFKKSLKCTKCGYVWHETKDHDLVMKKQGAIEQWRNSFDSLGGRAIVVDKVVYLRMTIDTGLPPNHPDEKEEYESKPLADFEDKTIKEFNFENLSPYHQKHINDPKYTWVNCCNMYILKSKLYKGDCPYHQRVLADGTLLWDEFNQDGEEL